MPLSGEAFGMLDKDAAYAGSSGKYYHSKNGAHLLSSYQECTAVKLWSDSEQLVRLMDSERPTILERTRVAA